jgi:hypothetical protein
MYDPIKASHQLDLTAKIHIDGPLFLNFIFIFALYGSLSTPLKA